MPNTLVCVDCRTSLDRTGDELQCPSCSASFPVHDGIADFARGEYYDSFDPARDILTDEHLRGLNLELDGSIRRINDLL